MIDCPVWSARSNLEDLILSADIDTTGRLIHDLSHVRIVGIDRRRGDLLFGFSPPERDWISVFATQRLDSQFCDIIALQDPRSFW